MDVARNLLDAKLSAIDQYVQAHGLTATDIDDVWHSGIASIAARERPPAWLLNATVPAREAAGSPV
jgi:hypothetical protein